MTVTTYAGYDLIPEEITERVSRGRWAVFHVCAIHRAGKLVAITPKRSSRAQAMKDGQIRAARLRLLEEAGVTR